MKANIPLGALLCSLFLAAVTEVAAGADSETAESLLRKARSVLAQLDGRLHVRGLHEPVEVLRDRWGVPHIFAKNQHDLFFAQGFVAAQDRLFQLDLWRRTATGETAEVTGPEGLQRDRFARLIRYRGDMKAEWESYSRDTCPIVTAFTDGINAYIDSVGDRLPIEFQILGFRPKKWTPQDCLGRTSALAVTLNPEQEVARAELVATLGLQVARKLMPSDPPVDLAPAEGLDLSGINAEVLAGFKAARTGPSFAPDHGSNNWAVGGALSVSGKPMLAGDPHRAITLPSLRYLVHLHAPGWNVIGAGEPALPGVAIGHNAHIAWAFTVAMTDQADLIVEQTHPEDSRRYRAGDAWVPMHVLREKVRVRGRNPVELVLCFTRNGPVIHEDRPRHRAYALRWVGSEPGTAAYLASLAVGRAGNWSECRQAAARWKTPPLNLMYADVNGNIGWIAAALTPVRKGWHGLLPVPGDSGKSRWHGFLRPDQYPQKLNPPEHFLVTANHKILPPGYLHEISYEWAAPYRHLRLLEYLRGKPRFDLDDFERMQYDQISIPARKLAQLLGRTGTPPPELVPYYKLMAGFDGNMDRSSAAAVLWGCWLPKLAEAYGGPKVPKHLVRHLYERNGLAAMIEALEAAAESQFGPDPVAKRNALMRSAFAEAVSEARRRLGDDCRGWQWGRLQTVAFRHPLASLGPPYAQAFSRGPLPRGSDRFAPNQSGWNERFETEVGATYRQVFDLADWERGRATSAPGQSGQPGSPYYDNLIESWDKGRYFPLAFSRAKVEEVVAHRLLLLPAKP
jgi:penicillin amidase